MTAITLSRELVQQVLEALEADNSKLWPSDKRTAALFELSRYPSGRPQRMEFNAQLQAENEGLRAQRDSLLEALRKIGKYTGEGPMYSTPWQDIVVHLGQTARAAVKAVEENT